MCKNINVHILRLCASREYSFLLGEASLDHIFDNIALKIANVAGLHHGGPPLSILAAPYIVSYVAHRS